MGSEAAVYLRVPIAADRFLASIASMDDNSDDEPRNVGAIILYLFK